MYPVNTAATGGNTTDGLETEYVKAGRFLKAIKCRNVISAIGNLWLVLQ